MAGVSDADDYMPSDIESSDAGAYGHGSAGDESGLGQSAQALLADDENDTSDFEEPDASPTSMASDRSRKRQAHHPPPYADAPLKRQRRTFNPEYLSLLNQDIADASIGIISLDALDLKPSQIGAVRWSPVEKEAFFSALGRLGRDDLPGIAARVVTKTPLEVRQFIMLLEERTKRRRVDVELRRKTLRPTELPAAAELSHECTAAAEEAADDLALRQENYEVAAEERKWGDRWLITQSTVSEEKDREDQGEKDLEMPFLDFFQTRAWLKLSERVFMNSVIPDYNWRYVSEEAPAIRATALSDFHALVVSITRRLVASTLFMAGMRIKGHKEYMPLTKNLVKAKDVKAAADTLNMKINSRDFWARAPRRLRLDIIQEEAGSGQDETEDEESEEEHVMSYEEVEAGLGVHTREHAAAPPPDDTFLNSDEDMEDDSDVSIQGYDKLGEETGEEEDEEDEEEERETLHIDNTLDQESIKSDMQEGMYFSADYDFTTRARQALQGRIVADHRMEADAEEQDLRASRQEEARLWSVLQKAEASEEAPSRNPEGKKWTRTVGFEPAAPNWRDTTQYVSEWETR